MYFTRYEALLPAVCQKAHDLNVNLLQILDAARPCPYALLLWSCDKTTNNSTVP